MVLITNTGLLTDALTGYGENAEEEAFMESEVAKAAEAQGQDARIAFRQDNKLKAPEDPMDVEESDLLNPQTATGKNWGHAAGILQNYFKQKQQGYTATVTPDGVEQITVDDPGLGEQVYNTAVELTTDLGDDDPDVNVNQGLLEHIGMMNWNLAYEGGAWAMVDEMPRDVALAQAAAMAIYEKLPDGTWSGTKRALKGLGTDPTTYVGGVAGLKFVKALLAGGTKYGTKQLLKERLLKRALGASFIGGEASAYTAFEEYMRQKLKDPDNPDFQTNWAKVGQAAGTGFVFGTGLTGAALSSPEIARGVKSGVDTLFDYADRAAAEGGATLFANPVGFLKPAAEGTRAHKVPHQLLVGGTGEKATTPVTQAFNANNKQANFANIDASHQAFPNALRSEEDWAGSLQTTLGGDSIVTPPRQAIKYANDPQAMADKLAKLTPDLKAGVDRGFEHVKRLRDMYQSGKATPVTTANLFLWGILSRGAGPVQQESAFLNIFEGAQPFIQKAIAGTFDEKALTQWERALGRYEVSPGEFANRLPEGSPARQVTMNVNAAGKLLMALSEEVAEGGKTKLQALHEMMSNADMSGPAVRRGFMEMTDRAGIDNKVVSFTLLVAGRDDVLVMDRIQSRHLWDDGAFEGFNLYDGYSKAGSTAKEGLHGLMRGPRGLLVTEMLERGLADNVQEAYRLAGRPQDASLGRFHWETWVIDGEQVVAHDTLETVATKKAEGVGVTEGKRATFSSGFNYVQGAKAMEAQYPLSDGSTVTMTLPKSKEFEAFIKSPKNGIVPKDFKVSESIDKPWYEQPGVDREKLDAAARKFSKRQRK